jgi:excisionase family DNA binding protein
MKPPTKRTETRGPLVGVSLAEPLLDCEAAASLLNVRVSWVREAARLGQVPHLRVGRHLRFSRGMLEDWIAEQLPDTPPPERAYHGPTGGTGARGGRAGVPVSGVVPRPLCWRAWLRAQDRRQTASHDER